MWSSECGIQNPKRRIEENLHFGFWNTTAGRQGVRTICKVLGEEWGKKKGQSGTLKAKIRIEGKDLLKSSLRGRRFVVRSSWVGGSVSSC